MIDELAEAKLRHPSSGMLQEVIASNAVRAFNEGFERGRVAERESIVELLEEQSRQCEKAGLYANGEDLRGQLQELHTGLNAAISFIKEQK